MPEPACWMAVAPIASPVCVGIGVLVGDVWPPLSRRFLWCFLW
ncbi:MAG: hypothetical protein QOG33_2471 [Gaiellales bacterium]|jgi:hypothetical protein|nr:hypothetical protein [Gaiellales bacterium]